MLWITCKLPTLSVVLTVTSVACHVQYQHIVHRQKLQSDDVLTYKSSCVSDTQSSDYTAVLVLSTNSRLLMYSALIHLLPAIAS